MEKVGVRELRRNFRFYLEKVKAGETIEITNRGRPVAIFCPKSSDHSPVAGDTVSGA